MRFIEYIQKQILIIDGAMGTQVQGLELTDHDFGGKIFRMIPDVLVMTQDQAIKKIHENYLQAGAMAIETNTFGASPLRLREFDWTQFSTANASRADFSTMTLDQIAHELNVQGATLAREAVRRVNPEAYVLGSMGPSNCVVSPTKAGLNIIDFDTAKHNFYVQARGLIEGGVDALLLETQQDVLEVKSAIMGIKQALKEYDVTLPLIVQVTVDEHQRMQIFNTDILTALHTLEPMGIDVFGINCSLGPDLMRSSLEKLSSRARVPLSVIPNAGLPVSEGGKTVYKCSPEEFALTLEGFADEFNVAMMGGCCGTTPEHIKALAKSLQGRVPRKNFKSTGTFITGPQRAIQISCSGPLQNIGERLNVRGSKKVRDAIEGRDEIDFGVIEEVVQEQCEILGADIIDVCMDSNQVDTLQTLKKVVQHICLDFRSALCLDSFDAHVLCASLKFYPGRPIINSISLEPSLHYKDKMDEIIRQTYDHAPVYLALCTSATGPAITCEEKVNLASQIYERACDEYHLSPDQIIIDVNIFPIGSEGDKKANYAQETLDAIRHLRQKYPQILLSLGVGNLTTGLAKFPFMRRVLTSVFVHKAHEVGLNLAIINPEHYVPIESLPAQFRELANKVIDNHDMEAFEELEQLQAHKKNDKSDKVDIYESLSPEEALAERIYQGQKRRCQESMEYCGNHYDVCDELVKDVFALLTTYKPLEIINQILMPAMRRLGDGFAEGHVSLPHLLRSADVMKMAMTFLEFCMRIQNQDHEIKKKGTVVLGTVFQDVHSIGKDLVKTLLQNYGYHVIDLGVQVPLEKFVAVAKEHNAMAIGMSALLVQTSQHMIEVARLVQKEKLDIDLLIGGAPVNKRHAVSVSTLGTLEEADLKGNVFYCATGMDAVTLLNQMSENSDSRFHLHEKNHDDLLWHLNYKKNHEKLQSEKWKNATRRHVEPYELIVPTVMRMIMKRRFTVKEFQPYIDCKTLFSLNWRYGGSQSWSEKGVTSESLNQSLQSWVNRCDKDQLILPQVLYGIFSCRLISSNEHSDTLMITDCENLDVTLTIESNKIIGHDGQIVSLANYFSQKQEQYCGLILGTVGRNVENEIEKLKLNGDLENAHLLQGLADRIAEDIVSYAHSDLRQKLKLQERQGQRYSPGYPLLQDLNANRTIYKLLKAQRMGVDLTEVHEFMPVSTTASFVCFHPEARYD